MTTEETDTGLERAPQTMPAAVAPRVRRLASQVNPNAVLAVVAVAQFMVILDASVVNVALPTIKGDLGFSEQSLSWILNAYTLVFGGFLLLGGRAADRLGRRRLFMATFLTQLSGRGDYTSHLLPAMVILGLGLGISFVPATIAATSGVARQDSGLAAGLLNTTQQVGGSLGLAILSTVATTRITDALDGGAALPVALTHGFTGAFTVSALLCAASAVLALVLLPRRKQAVKIEHVETIATSFARCPGAPYAGHLAREVALIRRMRRTQHKDVGPSS